MSDRLKSSIIIIYLHLRNVFFLLFLLVLTTFQLQAASPTATPVPLTASSATVPSTQAEEVTPTPTLPSAGKVIATFKVGARPLPVAIGEGAIWVKNGSGDVLRIDPATNQVVATFPVGGGEYGYITVGEGSVWASLYGSNMVARIDPQTNKIVATIPVGNAPEGIGVTPGAVWVANHHDGSVSRIDPATNTVTNTITDVGSAGANGPLVLVTGAGAVWVEVPNIGALVRIDPTTNAIVAKFPDYTGGIAADSENVWYGTTSGLNRIDPSTNQIVATIQMPLQIDSTNLALGLGSLWVKTTESLLRIDPQTNKVIGELQLPNGGGDVAFGEGSVWSSSEDSQSLSRIEPAPVSTAALSSPASTATPTPVPPESTPNPFTPIAHNADWTPVTQTIHGLDMVLVPAGSFLMGSTDAQVEAAFQQCDASHTQGHRCHRDWFEAEGPQAAIRFDAPFWMGRTEVTNAQYTQCVAAGACTPPSNRTYYDDPAYTDHPVVYVNWTQASDYAHWWGGRLPTEAEWEYAARGPDDLNYPWGNDFDGTRLNFCDNNCTYHDWYDPSVNDGYARTAPVGTYPAGASWVGALDMSGNVWEWVSSAFQPYPYQADDGREDVNKTGVSRTIRDGSWNMDDSGLRPAARFYVSGDLLGDGGIRCVLSY